MIEIVDLSAYREAPKPVRLEFARIVAAAKMAQLLGIADEAEAFDFFANGGVVSHAGKEREDSQRQQCGDDRDNPAHGSALLGEGA